ncbi:CPBP family intramembrane metalloprotease [Alcanivorax sp. S6407]|uniref:CPBP family intramembrane glutamic endopeptidase n=1 Tax=Alcanivorax sp. S6407 TaxID=2926424 RepID=UPI001FF5A11F|nr:CPBP family intramembrane metalloprotease [Alcanivorax sp. S6407]
MTPTKRRIGISLGIYLVWIAITMLGARFLVGGESSLDELVSRGIGWHFVAAVALLFAAIVIFRWHDLNFRRPHSLLRVMWFPSLYLLFFAGVIAIFGLPPLSVVVFVALNTLLVGISEEVMFRGVLFRAFDKAMAIWPAILITSVLFGAVHILNVFITGELVPALMQAVAATMSGIVFMAILLRTGSICPAIVYHFLWDCLLFLVGSAAHNSGEVAASGDTTAMSLALPILLPLPNLIFALILLRHVGRDRNSTAS